MNKRWIASVLCTVLLLGGCGGAVTNPQPGPGSSDQPPASGSADSGDPNESGDPSGHTTEPTEPAGSGDVSDPAGGPADSEPPAPTGPEVTWKPSGIGYPLVPSDPSVDKKVAMLTFDDGPSNYTPQVLDGLKAAGVKALFFITGYGAEQHPDLVKRIHEEGHVLGIHTMTHPNMTELSREEQIAEIQPLIDLITEVTGEPPKYFRPPFGAYDDELLATLDELGLEAINWSNGSLDWDGVVDGYKDPNLVVEAVLDQLHPGSVILAHDTMKHTAEAVPLIIDALRAEGYEFVVLP